MQVDKADEAVQYRPVASSRRFLHPYNQNRLPMKGFNFFQDSAKEWRWNLKDGNHKIVADSAEGYHHKADCEKGAALFTTLGVEAPERQVTNPAGTDSGPGAEYEYFVDKAGEWRWHFQAQNNKIIADSAEGYVSEHNVKRAITNVRSLLKEVGGGSNSGGNGGNGGSYVPPTTGGSSGPGRFA
ncbi:YegP family protein [Hymenobacter rubripertinctus]